METLHNVDDDAPFLLDGIAHGFQLVSDISSVTTCDSKNYRSAIDAATKPRLDKLFLEELELQRFTRVDSKPHRIQAIGAVPKKDSSTPRPITDCSRPLHDSLNSYLTAESFTFDSVDDVLKLSQPFSFFAVVDIKSAYRWVPIFPAHRTLQGFRWSFDDGPEDFYVDNFLCFGLSIAPAIFQRISTAIARTVRRAGHNIVSYLDDFLVVGDSVSSCSAAQSFLINLLHKLGFEVKWEKVIGPTQRVTFLGLTIDSVMQRIELPPEKIQALSDMASSLSQREKLTKKELEVLVGHMSFAARAIYGARTFSRIFIDVMCKLALPHHKTRLTKLLKAELTWWHDYAAAMNGLVPCLLGKERPAITIATDASFSGFGAVMNGQWLAGAWKSSALPPVGFASNWVNSPLLPLSFANNINFLELVAACLPLLVWSSLFSGCRVTILSDNTQTVAFLKRGTTKDLSSLKWLKLIFYASLHFDFHISAAHCPGLTNVEADALSRLSESSRHADRFLEAFSYTFPGPVLPKISCYSYPSAQSGSSLEALEDLSDGRIIQENSTSSVAPLQDLLPGTWTPSSTSLH